MRHGTKRNEGVRQLVAQRQRCQSNQYHTYIGFLSLILFANSVVAQDQKAPEVTSNSSAAAATASVTGPTAIRLSSPGEILNLRLERHLTQPRRTRSASNLAGAPVLNHRKSGGLLACMYGLHSRTGRTYSKMLTSSKRTW